MEFDIVPYLRAGPIAFGLARAEVRQRLGGPVRTFLKTDASAAPTDAFEDFDLHVHYDADDRCASAEFGSGRARRHAVPVFRGQRLIGRPLLDVQRWLSAIDPDLNTIDTLTVSFGFGFGVSAPSDDAETPVRDVIVFREDYYDRDSLPFRPLLIT